LLQLQEFSDASASLHPKVEGIFMKIGEISENKGQQNKYYSQVLLTKDCQNQPGNRSSEAKS